MRDFALSTLQRAFAITMLVSITQSLNGSSCPINRDPRIEEIDLRCVSKSSTSKAPSQNETIYEANSPIRDNNKSGKPPSLGSLQNHLRLCGYDRVCLRLTAEYGSIFAANPQRVLVPPLIVFRDESDVKRFQKRAGISAEVINGVRVELQPEALKAFLAARTEALQRGLNITPRGSNSSRRSYADTVDLWQNRVNDGLTYWANQDKLTRYEIQLLRSLPANRQVPRILALEARGIYFGAGYRKSILESVAAPGSSQHIAMLAMDISQYQNARVREILASHGWFRTVRNDAPHFTYLGVDQAALPSRGLRREIAGGMAVWIPSIGPLATGTRPESSKNGTRATRPKDALKGNTTDEHPDESEQDLIRSPRRPVRGTVSLHVTIIPTMKPILNELTNGYFRVAGGHLHITSAYRTPEAQAMAMYSNLVSYGRDYVLRTYGGRPAATEIISAYLKNRKNRMLAISAMTKVILGQVDRGLYISRHMLGRAFDIRLSSANASLLREVVRGLGGHLGIEADHYHVEF